MVVSGGLGSRYVKQEALLYIETVRKDPENLCCTQQRINRGSIIYSLGV